MNEYLAGAMCVTNLTAAARYALAADPPPFITRPDGCVFRGEPTFGAESAGGVPVLVTYSAITETGNCATTAPAPVGYIFTPSPCAFAMADAMPLAWGIVAVWVASYAFRLFRRAL